MARSCLPNFSRVGWVYSYTFGSQPKRACEKRAVVIPSLPPVPFPLKFASDGDWTAGRLGQGPLRSGRADSRNLEPYDCHFKSFSKFFVSISHCGVVGALESSREFCKPK